MPRWLKQSTSVDVPIGPFVDQTDGFTAESALTVTQPDIRLKKNAAAWAQKNAAQTLSHEENGYYEVTLDATDTNTLGLLRLAVNESGALPIFEDFLVVPANIYDSFFSTDFLQVDLAQWLGVAPVALLSQLVQISVQDFGSSSLNNAAFNQDTGLKSIRSATCQAGSGNSITLDASASATTDFYKGAHIYLTGGPGAGQSRLCTAYNGSTKVASVEPNWITNPVGSSTAFAIREDASASAMTTGGITSTSFAAGAIDDNAVAANMDSYSAKVWVIREGTTADHYAVAFYKNGQRVTSGVTSPTIQVIKGSDGTDLIASTALTEIGSTHRFKKDESTNKMVAGAIYFAVVGATIDGSGRSWDQQIGRDS